MAKSGRYSAQRMKVEGNITTDKTVEVHDCGTIFIMNSAGGNLTVTMPSAADAGAGWWCRVIRSDNNNDVNINVSTNMADDAASNAGVGGGAGGSDCMETIAGDFGLDADGSKGDHVEMYTDGEQWFCLAFSGATTGINV